MQVWRALMPLVLLSAPLRATVAAVQQITAVVVPDELECPSCTLKRAREIVLGEKKGEHAIIDRLNAVRVDGLGRYWVMAGDKPPLVFDSIGQFVARLGRTGSGPGETIRPLDAVPLPGDSMLVFDGELSRLTVFDRNLKAVRTMQLGVAMRPWLVLQWPDRVVGSGQLGSPESAGWSLHLGSLTPDGFHLQRSFGPGRGEIRPRDYGRTGQLLATARAPNSFWSSDETMYRVSSWSAEGSQRLQMTRRPSWFASQSTNTLGGPTRPPQPRVSCIAEGKDGHLWVAVRMPKSTWREGWPAIQAGEYPLSAIAFEKMFRTTLEVLNPESRKVVARFELQDWIIDCLPDGRFVINATDEDGVFQVRIAWFELGR